MKFTQLALSFFAGAAALASLVWSPTLVGSPVARLVQELPTLEVSLGLVLHGGYLFSAVSRVEAGESHHLVVMKGADLSKVVTLDLPHSAMEIYPLTSSSVLVLGKSVDPWEGKYSEVSWASGEFLVSTRRLPSDIIPEAFAGSFQRMIFAEPGSQGIYLWSGSRMNRFTGDVSGPGAMAVVGENLWILSRGDLFNLGDERIAIASLADRAVAYSSIDPNDTVGLYDLRAVSNGRFVLGTNVWAKKMVAFDSVSQKKVGELSVDQVPVASAAFGSCAATLDPDGMSIEVAKIGDEGSLKSLVKLDISGAGDRLKRPRKMLLDVENRRILVRSAYPCGSCSVTQSSVFAIEDRDATWWAECQAR